MLPPTLTRDEARVLFDQNKLCTDSELIQLSTWYLPEDIADRANRNASNRKTEKMETGGRIGSQLDSALDKVATADGVQGEDREHLKFQFRDNRVMKLTDKYGKDSRAVTRYSKHKQYKKDVKRFANRDKGKKTSAAAQPSPRQESAPSLVDTLTPNAPVTFDMSILRKINDFKPDLRITAYRINVRQQLYESFGSLPAQIAAIFPNDPDHAAFEGAFNKSYFPDSPIFKEMNRIFRSVCLVTIMQWVYQLPVASQIGTSYDEPSLVKRLLNVVRDYGGLRSFSAITFEHKGPWYTVVYGHYMLALMHPGVSQHLNLAIVMELVEAEYKSAEVVGLKQLLEREDLQDAPLPPGTASLETFMASVTLNAMVVWLRGLETMTARPLFATIGDDAALKLGLYRKMTAEDLLGELDD
ncbi:hypothetical protein Slin15195_G109280 [Septoria linicola]|uniref:Uncharacterized protein n=1 Tax=Septoria linicola TaxID=215465 RepID=A0A9Q9AYQ8_9PEZI|nr:hypothetical protein Slin15195_G109280 [Septoria linicola]